ncbi:MAG: radical SAM protein [Chloroflexota bacterium]|jgi:radical SAM protein with 4Fe4S-binding SPASM domain
MVGQNLATAGRQALRALRDDLTAVMALRAASWSPEPGLHTYELDPEYGRRRIHLRLDADGRGVLFVDVTDVIHLNQTAAAMAKLALDGQPISSARARLLTGIRPADRPALNRDLAEIYAMIARLQSPDGSCPTCAIGATSLGALENAPLFSVPARAPYKVDLALTYGCNNACGHCYNEPERFTMPSLTREEWLAVIDKLHQIGVPHVIFTGGEATLHPDLPELIHYADSLGLVTGLNTNGRRIADRDYMDRLAASGLNHVQVTLGSSRPAVHDAIMGARSFGQTVRGIQNAIAAGVHCITNTTIMACNRDHTAEIIHFLYDLGIRTFAMNGMIYSGGGLYDPNAIPEAEMPPILIRVRDTAAELGMRFLWYTPTEYCRMSPVELEIGAKRCNAAEYSVCVEPSGDVLPCQSYYVAAGNILRDPWEHIWQGHLFRSFRDRNDDPRASGLPEKCWDCPDLPLCGGGCRLEREARSAAESGMPCAGGCSGNGNRQTAAAAGFVASPGATSAARRSRGNLITLQDIVSEPSLQAGNLKPTQKFPVSGSQLNDEGEL